MTDTIDDIFKAYVDKPNVTKVSPSEVKQSEPTIDDKYYEISKPKRIIIRGKLFNDSVK